MRKLLLIIPVLFCISCSKKDNEGCTCYGKFTKDGTGFFYGQNVDCTTGEPVLSNQTGDTFFLGCVD